jgi:Tfp pilus assembly protein PilX
VKVRGIALLMGLVLLAAVSLLALMAANSMVLQRRMSANFGAQSIALAQAARATAAARAWLESRADVEREPGCLTHCLLPRAIHGPGELPRHPEFESAAWWRVNGLPAGIHPESGESLTPNATEDNPPFWIIEELRYEPRPATSTGATFAGIGYYRIFARGHGGSATSLAFTETIVARPWDGEYDPLPYPVTGPTGEFCGQFDPSTPCGTQSWRQRR